MNYSGAVGIHELMVFYGKATPEEEQQMQHCMESKNVACVKQLLTKVTGMPVDKIDEMTDFTTDRAVRQQYVNYARNSIRQLKLLKQIKDRSLKKSEVSDMIRTLKNGGKIDIMPLTRSGVESILVGLGERNNFSTLKPEDQKIARELQSYVDPKNPNSKIPLTWNDGILSKLGDLYEL